jgi:hypothetical protein
MPELHSGDIPSAEQIKALDSEALNALTALCLSQYEPGFLPLSVFKEWARIGVLSTVEVIPLMHDETDNRTKVIVTRRPESNDWWSGKLHVPGNALLATDTKDEAYSYRAPIARLVKKELGDAVSIVGSPQLLRGRFAGDAAERGRESTLIYWAEVTPVDGKKLPENAQFYDAEKLLDNPPGDFIAAHNEQVLDAWAAFEEARREGYRPSAEMLLAHYRGQ